jgi:peroxiredoxin
VALLTSRRLALLAALSGAACGHRGATDRPGGEAFRPLAPGDAAPDYQAVTLAGDTIRIGPGEPITLMNVWATWCTSCREEMADLQAIGHDYQARGLRLLAVSVDQGNPDHVRRFVATAGLTFPVAIDSDEVVEHRFQTVGVPETYLIGTDGRLLWRHAGGIHADPGAARTAIEQALAGAAAAPRAP